MVKKLLFNFYGSWETLDCFSNKLHFSLLKKYIDIFDEMFINISIDDINDLDLVKEIENRFLELQGDRTITFKVSKNNYFRESQLAYDEIYLNEDENKLIFFAHNKGVTNFDESGQDPIQIDSIISWIVGIYFFNFIDMDEVETFLVSNQKAAYGAFLSISDITTNRYKYMYYGTFFWVNNYFLHRAMKQNGNTSKMDNRYYSEKFLGDLVDFEQVYSHNHRFLTGNSSNYIFNYYDYTNFYIHLICENNEEEEFKELKNNILKEIGYNV